MNTSINLNEYVLPHYDCDHCGHGQFLIHAFLHALGRNIRNNWSTHPRYFLMENQNQNRNIDPQKTKAEKLNGRFALVGLIALVGANITTGQIVPGII